MLKGRELPPHMGESAASFSLVGRERALAAGVVLLALLLALVPPFEQRRLAMPDPWAYALAIEQFAQGHWRLDEETWAAARLQARLEGGHLLQYAQVAPGQWALRKAPGYPLLVIPFQWLGMPRLANGALAVAAALALYSGLAAWRDERVAWQGVALFLGSPIALVALHTSTMDTFASGALPAIAGALLLGYDTRQGHGRWEAPRLLMAGLAAGWAVVVRLPNAPLLALFFLFLLSSLRRHKAPTGQALQHGLAFSVGVALALGAWASYNVAAFGHPVDTGYRYASPYQALFLWEAAPATHVEGIPTWLAERSWRSAAGALGAHARQWLQPLGMGWPWLPLVLVGWLLASRSGMWRLWGGMTAWGLAVYAPYAGLLYFGITRELAVPFYRSWGFFAVDRYLFPAAFPLALLATLALARIPRYRNAIVLALFALSTALYLRAIGQR